MRYQDLLPVPHWNRLWDPMAPMPNMFDDVRSHISGIQQYDLKLLGDNRYCLSLEVPGFERDDLTVEVENDTLIVRGVVQKDTRPDDSSYLYRGFTQRGFERAIRIGGKIDVKSARLQDGLLEIEFHADLPEPARRRRIEIRNGGEGWLDRAKKVVRRKGNSDKTSSKHA